MFKLSFCGLFIFLSLETSSLMEDEFLRPDFLLRVMNGIPARLGDVPYQIAFKQRVGRYYKTYCGGVLIAPKKLLSAAHCFEERGSKCFNRGRVSRKYLAKTMAVAGNLYNVGALQADSLQNGQWRQLKSMVYPPTYKFPKNDISVGFTKKAFVINEYVAPIPYTTRFADYQGKCLASGFGRISQNQGSEILLLAHLTVIGTSLCSIKHRKNMAKFVCTESIVTDVGKGDSGGPLVCASTGDPKEGPKGILVGIVSGSRHRVGSFFTRVSSFSKLIKNNKGTVRNSNNDLLLMCLLHGSVVLFLFCFI